MKPRPLAEKPPRHNGPGEFLNGESVLLRVLCVWLGFIGVSTIDRELFAQEQPLVMEEPDHRPVSGRSDPLRESALSPELKELAREPLPFRDGRSETEWREILAPVFSFIEGLPVHVVEQGAFKYRRARIRLTEEVRRRTGQKYRLLENFENSPEVYRAQPVALHGYLLSLRRIPAPPDAEDASAWHEGRLKLWNDDKTVRFVARLIPETLPTKENMHEPVEVVGYVFSTAENSEKPSEPLVVTRWVRWLKPGLDLRTLVRVKDRTIGIPEEEADAYYRTLLHAALMEESDLRKQAEEFWSERQKQLERPRPLFVDLFKSFEEDPNLYRGRAVTLDGTLRKLRRITVDPLNDFGIDVLYEAWIFAEDSQSNPTVVVFSENSADLPEGDDLNIPVRVTGYVFKMYGYESRDAEHPLRLAPMLLAKTMRKFAIAKPAPFPLAWVAGAITLLCLGIVLFLWSSSRKDKQVREKIMRKDEPEEPPRFEHLNGP